MQRDYVFSIGQRVKRRVDTFSMQPQWQYGKVEDKTSVTVDILWEGETGPETIPNSDYDTIQLDTRRVKEFTSGHDAAAHDFNVYRTHGFPIGNGERVHARGSGHSKIATPVMPDVLNCGEISVEAMYLQYLKLVGLYDKQHLMPIVQQRETRRAFYGAVGQFLSVLWRIDTVEPEESAEMICRLGDEVGKFFEQGGELPPIT